MNKKIKLSIALCCLINTSIYAQELFPITIVSTLIDTNEKDATYASEIYTKADINNSRSKNVYDFLKSQTSINISPSYGNVFVQKIDLRGYGIGDGYQNVVISINGRKLNNIDMVPQLLSSISINSIESIEIIKGSGSVQFGDGANAGVINIITNGKNDNFITAYIGKNGIKNGALSLSHSSDKYIVNAYMDSTSTKGSRELVSGNKDKNYSKNKLIEVLFFPTDSLEFRLSRSFTNINTTYGSSLTLNEYKQNVNHANSFTEQYFSSYTTNLGMTYDFKNDYKLDLNYTEEDKLSKYSTGYSSEYEYKTYNIKLSKSSNRYSTIIGIDGGTGDRISSSNITSKDSIAIFSSINYNISNNLILSAGARKEEIKYKYNPTSANSLSKKKTLDAVEFGGNYKLNNNSSLFASFAKSYQSPDIDRFFTSAYGPAPLYLATTSFNGFIEPSKVNTFTLGYNNIKKNNKLKISIFRANLKNEIYYYKSVLGTSLNTNIDKSYKQGIELYDKFLFSDNIFASINYSYIIAKIDHEDQGNGSFNDKYLPGVSKHNASINIGYNNKIFKSILTHTYRSSAYAANDFENSFTQKQDSFNTTDLNLSYTYKNFEIFGKIENLFDNKNGLWIKDDAIYPINFERTYYAGLKINF